MIGERRQHYRRWGGMRLYMFASSSQKKIFCAIFYALTRPILCFLSASISSGQISATESFPYKSTQNNNFLSFPLSQPFLQPIFMAPPSQENLIDPNESDIIITAERRPQHWLEASSAITRISSQDIPKYGGSSLKEVLHLSPGIDIYEQGGTGGLTQLYLRGAKPGQTLVLLNNVRIGDPAGIDGSFDWSVLSPTDIERVEIVRGPQSALYGSDAMGGVIQIITRQGCRPLRRQLYIEGGSYGTILSRASVSGAYKDVSYALSAVALHTAGFSRYGERIPRIMKLYPQGLEKDPSNKWGIVGRVHWQIFPKLEAEIGFAHYWKDSKFDNPSAFSLPERDVHFDHGRQNLQQIYARTIFQFNLWKHSITSFLAQSHRQDFAERSCFYPLLPSHKACQDNFQGNRWGAEYQGERLLGPKGGTWIIGTRFEQEQAHTSSQGLNPKTQKLLGFKGSQTTTSLFTLYHLPLHKDLQFSMGGRLDKVGSQEVFATWKAGLTYHLPATHTRFHFSSGTGAKAPSLYQRFGPYGLPTLQPEYNYSLDFGITQTFFSNRLALQMNAFYSPYRDLIDYNNKTQRYFNIGRVGIHGLELAVEGILIPDLWRTNFAYTYMQSEDLDKRLPLLRRPHHKAFFALTYLGLPNWEFESRLTAVSSRWDIDHQAWDNIAQTPLRVLLKAYLKLDFYIRYKATDSLNFFARFENVTNTKYEEIRDYGTAGTSVYAGLSYSW